MQWNDMGLMVVRSKRKKEMVVVQDFPRLVKKENITGRWLNVST